MQRQGTPCRLNEIGSLLPAGMLYVKAKNVDKSNVIQWATATEYNSDHFEIQRSADGKTFSSIGSVAAAGMSAKTIEYSFTDEQAPANISYYRLMQVDKDGSFHYSAIASVNNSQGKWIIDTYPNPVADELYLHVDASENGINEFEIG